MYNAVRMYYANLIVYNSGHYCNITIFTYNIVSVRRLFCPVYIVVNLLYFDSWYSLHVVIEDKKLFSYTGDENIFFCTVHRYDASSTALYTKADCLP